MLYKLLNEACWSSRSNGFVLTWGGGSWVLRVQGRVQTAGGRTQVMAVSEPPNTDDDNTA